MADRRSKQLAEERAAIDSYVLKEIKKADVYDRYDESDELGSGAFGRVWRGIDLDDDDRVYAIKTIACPDEKALGREVKASHRCSSHHQHSRHSSP